MTDVGKRGDRDTVDEFLSPWQKNPYSSGLSLFNSVGNLNFFTRPHPERFAFATLFTMHPASRRMETPAVTLRDARLQVCFANCSKSPVIRISPDLPQLPCRLPCRMNEARGVIRGEYVAVFPTRNLNRSPTHQPDEPIDSGCFCIRMHVSLPKFG
jgi:hypothetical protein